MGRKKDRSEELRVSTRWTVLLVYLLLLVLFAGVLYSRNLSADVWWQLKTGQWIVEHHSLPSADPFAYTSVSPITLHEWGAEVVEWFVYSKVSPNALAVMSILLTSAAFLFVFRMAFARSRHLLATFLVVAAGVLASARAAEIRPQMFSWMFLILALLILQRFYKRGWRGLWLLPLLILLWVNFHGAFIVGLALIGLETIVALLAPPEWARSHRLPRLAAAGPLAVVSVAGALAALVNPNGLGTYVFPLRMMEHPGVMTVTPEWTSPNFHEWTGKSLLALFGMAAVGLAFLRNKPSLRDFAYVACFAAAALVSRRNMIFFSLACAAPISLWLSHALDEGFLQLSKLRLAGYVRACTWVVLVIVTAGLFFGRLSDARGRSAFDYMTVSDASPVGACDFIRASHIAGPMFNECNYGGHLIWRLWPEHKVFAYNLQDLFLHGAFEEAYAATCAKPGTWKSVFERHRINFAVLPPTVPLVSVLSEREDWARVYQDDKAVIFVRNTPENASTIESSLRR